PCWGLINQPVKVHFVMVVGRDFSFLLLQEYCHDTFKLSAYPLADTHRYYHYPVCAGVGLYLEPV
ncbi:hypothetical protein PV939_12115, partial [Ligilactobacillus salivarius]|nr:hypothetical protein [Ligilactobacillus salivarius]